MALLLDTHIWIWLAEGDRKLSTPHIIRIEKSRTALYVSAASVWEIAMLSHRGKLFPDRPVRLWVAESLQALGVEVIPLTTSIALESYALPGEFHGDPADRMIVATTREKGLKLMTQDKAILQYAKLGHLAIAS